MNRRLLKAPGYFVTGYFLLGVTIATIGPLEYVGYSAGTVALYVASILLFFNYGFSLGTVTTPRTKPLWRLSHNKPILTTLFRVSLVISIVLMTYELFQSIRSGGLSLNLENAAQSYLSTYTDYTRNSGSYTVRFLVTSIGAFPLFVAEVLGIFYFRSLKRATQIAVIYLLVVTVLVYALGDGKLKQLGDLMIYVTSLGLAYRAATGSINIGRIWTIAAVLAAGVYLMGALLAFRYQAIGVNLSNLDMNLHPLIKYRGGDWLVDTLGEALAVPLIMLSGYLSQGYYGLSLALEQPFIWTRLAGSSYSVSVMLNQWLGADFWVLDNYPYRVGLVTGWDQTKWHTVFAWLASDLSFPGVVMFMGLMGFIYGRVWRESILFRNPFAIMMFVTMNIGIVYAPANNQLMHSPGALTTTLALWVMYCLFHANFNAAPTALGRK